VEEPSLLADQLDPVAVKVPNDQVMTQRDEIECGPRTTESRTKRSGESSVGGRAVLAPPVIKVAVEFCFLLPSLGPRPLLHLGALGSPLSELSVGLGNGLLNVSQIASNVSTNRADDRRSKRAVLKPCSWVVGGDRILEVADPGVRWLLVQGYDEERADDVFGRVFVWLA
jgi:hypothetical protein